MQLVETMSMNKRCELLRERSNVDSTICWLDSERAVIFFKRPPTKEKALDVQDRVYKLADELNLYLWGWRVEDNLLEAHITVYPDDPEHIDEDYYEE